MQRDISDKLTLKVATGDIHHDFDTDTYTVDIQFVDENGQIVKVYEAKMSNEFVCDVEHLSSGYLKEHNGPTEKDIANAAMEAVLSRYEKSGNKIPNEAGFIFKSYS